MDDTRLWKPRSDSSNLQETRIRTRRVTVPKGFDTTQDISAQAAAIKAAGYDFVARYLSQSHWKVIGTAVASAISAAGLGLVLVYEDGPTTSDYFSFGRGQADGTRAAQQAGALGAPAGTTLYFAVDYDASAEDISGVVTQYFTGVVGALKSLAAANGTAYAAGVYGSGSACNAITAGGLASYGWLTQARGWSGHDTYSGWSISQGMPAVIAGLSVDPDDAIGDYGVIPPAPIV
jgi:hypothetical protein